MVKKQRILIMNFISIYLVCFKINATNDFDIDTYLNLHNESINYCG